MTPAGWINDYKGKLGLSQVCKTDGVGMTRQRFIQKERDRINNLLLDAETGPTRTIYWNVHYSCTCGFKCNSAGKIYDHLQTCKAEVEKEEENDE